MNIRIALVGVLLVAAPHIAVAEDDCPEAFRGASISAADIHDGVTLTFTTESARIRRLRDELRALAIVLEQKATEIQTASYDEDVAFPPVDLEVFDVDGGARVSVRASRPRDIPELRVLAKSFEHYWAGSTCTGDYLVIREVPKKPAKRAAPRTSRH